MQFLLLLLTNVFIGAVVYLVISLKLEKKSTEYREEKFRKEMDEIMREFNSAAERNISLLENKIEVIKKLLQRSGQLKSVDFTIGELNKQIESDEINELSKNNIVKDENVNIQENLLGTKEIESNINTGKSDNLKKSLLILFNKIIIFYKNFKGLKNKFENEPTIGIENNTLIEINYQKIKSKESIVEPDEINAVKDKEEISKVELSEEEIRSIVSSTSDMNSLITRLFENGCSIENISKYSGIPVGEIKLVLNLNNAM